MRTLALVTLGLLACGTSSNSAPQSKANETPVPAPEPLAVQPDDPVVRGPSPDKVVHPEAPAESAPTETRRMFVIADKTSVCPTRDQATARKCGNSVESADQGVIMVKGSVVWVAGDAPVDGLWKSVRFQKSGILPAWVRADDVAKAPALPFLDEWDKRSDVQSAPDAATMTPKKLVRMRKGKLVKWQRVAAPKLGEDAEHTHVYMDLGKAGWIAIRLPPPSSEGAYMERHDCLLNGDCIGLSYLCDDSYCDSVSILAKATGKKVPPPEDEQGEWTGGKKRMPLFISLAFADRFGVFEATKQGKKSGKKSGKK